MSEHDGSLTSTCRAQHEASPSSVTVVVPTKNAARTLSPCLQSLRDQTYPCRIVVVDNKSTDTTVEIAQQTADLVLHWGPERSAQRNYGARSCRADVVGFIDADMVLEPAVVQEAVEALQNGAGSVIVPERTVGSGSWAQVRAFERSFYVGSDAIEAARFFRWDIFERTGGFDEELTGPEDWDLTESARALAPVARTRAWIEHDEGAIRYFEACRKKAYYAEGLRRYMAKRGVSAVYLAGRRPWLWHPNKILSRQGLGLLALKAGEAAAVLVALTGYRIKRLTSPLSAQRRPTLQSRFQMSKSDPSLGPPSATICDPIQGPKRFDTCAPSAEPVGAPSDVACRPELLGFATTSLGPEARPSGLSVLVPSYGRFEKVTACLASLVPQLDELNGPSEIIVVTSGYSTAELASLRAAGATLISLPEPLVLASSRNLAAEHASYQHLLFLDDDNRVLAGSVAALLSAMQNHPEVAMVGPVMYYYHQPRRLWCSGVQRSRWLLRTNLHRYSADDIIRHRSSLLPSDDFPNCFLVRAEDFHAIGGFDAAMFPSVYCESELSRRLVARTRRGIALVPAASVWHDHAGTLSRSLKLGNTNGYQGFTSPAYYDATGRARYVSLYGTTPQWLFHLVIGQWLHALAYSILVVRSSRRFSHPALVDYWRGVFANLPLLFRLRRQRPVNGWLVRCRLPAPLCHHD